MLGTGESSDWVARFDATDMHKTVLEYMQKSPLVDGRFIAHIGFSFSGYYAARLAMIEPRLFAVIAACAGVKAPLLIVNGDKDNLVPVSDLHLLADAGRETDLWIMGGDAHCFGQYRSIVMPKMANWLKEKLEAGKPPL